jgi:hypothetical protein
MSQDKESLILDIPSHFKLIPFNKKHFNIYEESFVNLVKKECELIKKHFTEAQIDKLIASKIDGESTSACVYGTMVGDCNTPEVANFIIDNLDTLIVSNTSVGDLPGIDVYNRSFESLMTPLEQYITPTAEEDYNMYWNEETGEDEYPDSYYERIREVVNWIKE